MLVSSRDRRNDMDDDFEEYVEDYDEDTFEVNPPMSEIKDESNRTLTRRGFEKKTVDFSKKSSGFSRRGSIFGSKSRGLPSRDKQGPTNRTRGKSPFNYESGLQLHRNTKSRDEAESNYPEDKPTKKLSWGVPWKR